MSKVVRLVLNECDLGLSDDLLTALLESLNEFLQVFGCVSLEFDDERAVFDALVSELVHSDDSEQVLHDLVQFFLEGVEIVRDNCVAHSKAVVKKFCIAL